MMKQSSLSLDFPTMNAFDSYIEALREGFYQGGNPKATAEEINAMLENPSAHLEELNEQKTGKFVAPDGSQHERVPYEQLWLTEGSEFIGSYSFRLKLSSFLKEFGGHVGYGIRPKYQGKGYGSKGLALVKERGKNMHGLTRLFLTCDESNKASEKVILNNDGIYQDTIGDIFGFAGPTKRFWIELKV